VTASQPTGRRAAAVWRAVRRSRVAGRPRAAGALRAIHGEQALTWELFWPFSRVPAGRTGSLAWASSLDGARVTGSDLPIPGDASAGQGS
jgi:hypothetical protein